MWAGAGLVLAAGLLTKYVMVLAVPALVLALLGSRRGRAALKTPGPWLTILIGLGLFVPVFLWGDARQGWPTLRYHLAARHEWHVSTRAATMYVGGHLGAISPVLAIGILWAIVHWWRRRTWRGLWLASFACVPIAFFLVPSLLTRRTMVRVHWDAPGYAAGILALALILGGRGARRRQRTGLATAALVPALL